MYWTIEDWSICGGLTAGVTASWWMLVEWWHAWWPCIHHGINGTVSLSLTCNVRSTICSKLHDYLVSANVNKWSSSCSSYMRYLHASNLHTPVPMQSLPPIVCLNVKTSAEAVDWNLLKEPMPRVNWKWSKESDVIELCHNKVRG